MLRRGILSNNRFFNFFFRNDRSNLQVLPDISAFPPLFYRTVMEEVPAGFRVAISRFVATGTITIRSFLISHEG